LVTTPLADLLSLNVSERIQLVQGLWDSIAAGPESLPPTTAQLEEPDHLADAAAHPGIGASR
jgi:putative addiction module component (TIGR02574 family)